MRMTREEATAEIERLFECAKKLEGPQTFVEFRPVPALEMALAALRPVSREQVEKVWKGCPEGKQRCGLCVHMGAWDRHGKPYVCEQCVDYSNFESDQRFCPVCGRPLTDEAVRMVMERMEKLYEQTSN